MPILGGINPVGRGLQNLQKALDSPEREPSIAHSGVFHPWRIGTLDPWGTNIVKIESTPMVELVREH
jgi:hypothetical protein